MHQCSFNTLVIYRKEKYMDLTKVTPRSVRDRVFGIVQLARTTDKAKAVAHGTIGEYVYDCPMDKGLFEFLGINGTEYLKVVNYVQNFLAKKTPQEVGDFNKRCLTAMPSGESLEHFTQMRAKIAPDRMDVKTWPDLLDLEEGRSVPHRTPVTISA
jgi:Domain of unknown function (DUF5069)